MNSALSDVIDTERKYPDIRDTRNCDAFHQSNLNNSSSPNHSQPSPSLQPTDKDDGGVANKNSPPNDVLDRRLQNCDISISPPGIINFSSSTSYVYTKKSEISKNHFEETVRTQEISSFYDISNSSTV